MTKQLTPSHVGHCSNTSANAATRSADAATLSATATVRAADAATKAADAAVVSAAAATKSANAAELNAKTEAAKLDLQKEEAGISPKTADSNEKNDPAKVGPNDEGGNGKKRAGIVSESEGESSDNHEQNRAARPK